MKTYKIEAHPTNGLYYVTASDSSSVHPKDKNVPVSLSLVSEEDYRELQRTYLSLVNKVRS